MMSGWRKSAGREIELWSRRENPPSIIRHDGVVERDDLGIHESWSRRPNLKGKLDRALRELRLTLGCERP
jgi:hypothetical protein